MPTAFDQNLLAVYRRKFTKLKQGGTQFGKAPHKPVFLITLLELFDKQIITNNQLTVTPELVATFKENFSLLVKTAYKDDFTQPFFYLQSDGFWFLKTQTGELLDTYVRSVQTLSDRLKYGYFAEDLFNLLTNEYARLYLKNTLLDHYFADTKTEFIRVKNAGRSYLNDLELYLLNAREVTYVTLQSSVPDVVLRQQKLESKCDLNVTYWKALC